MPAVLAALDGAGVAHLATHGQVHRDSPLFSSLLLADGPLTVYDLERLHRAPQLVVLAACDIGRSVVRAGDELLGLAATRLLLGTGELPPGSNHNHITDWYGVGNTPWCDIAISFEAAHSGNLAAVGGKFAWTVAHADSFRDRGRWHYGLGGARAGDVVFFDWSGGRTIAGIDHVGLIEAVHTDGTITTLEGNTSDQFGRRRRNASCVVGYGRPTYDDASPMPGDDGILRRGSTGAAVKALQRNLNTVLATNLALDGDFGPATAAAVKTFQARLHIAVDGEYGPQSAAAMKAALSGQGAPIRPTLRVPAAGELAIDGQFGPATCAALQRALDAHGAGIAVDGVFGPQTIKALQQRVGVEVDGEWGPQTTRGLQRALAGGMF